MQSDRSQATLPQTGLFIEYNTNITLHSGACQLYQNIHIQYMVCMSSLCLVMQTKVRDVKYCRDILRLASLSADGTVKLWDPNLTCLQSVSSAQKGSKDIYCHFMT